MDGIIQSLDTAEIVEHAALVVERPLPSLEVPKLEVGIRPDPVF